MNYLHKKRKNRKNALLKKKRIFLSFTTHYAFTYTADRVKIGRQDLWGRIIFSGANGFSAR